MVESRAREFFHHRSCRTHARPAERRRKSIPIEDRRHTRTPPAGGCWIRFCAPHWCERERAFNHPGWKPSHGGGHVGVPKKSAESSFPLRTVAQDEGVLLVQHQP